MLQVLRNSAVIWEYLANRTPYHTRPSLRGLEQKPWLICHCNWNKFHSTYSTEVCLKSTYTIIGKGLMYWSSKLPGGYWHSLYLVAVAHGLTPFGHRFGIPLLENWKVTIRHDPMAIWNKNSATVPQFEAREYLIKTLVRLKVIRESEVPKPVQGFRLSCLWVLRSQSTLY